LVNHAEYSTWNSQWFLVRFLLWPCFCWHHYVP
jgi:hypothetical protein